MFITPIQLFISFLLAHFLLSGINNDNVLLQDAAKDLLTLLSIDKNNKEASKLLHQANNPEDACKVLLGLLINDPSCAMVLGRLDGIEKLLNLHHSALAFQVIACTCSYTPFVRTFAASQISQSKMADIVDNRDGSLDYKMAAISV